MTMLQTSTSVVGRRLWRFPQIIFPTARPKLDIWTNAPQLQKFREDGLENTVAEDQTKVDQACASLTRKAKLLGFDLQIDNRSGLLDQRKVVDERAAFVRMANCLILEVDGQEVPDGLSRHWFAVTAIHACGINTTVGDRALLAKLSDLHQARRRKLGRGALEIGWKDLSRNTNDKGEVVWCWHIHSAVGVIAPDRETGAARVKAAYKIHQRHPDVGRPLDVRDTFVNVDFRKPAQSIAGWLAYSSRSSRLSMNIQRNKRLNGPLDRPGKLELHTVQMEPLIPLFATLKTGDRRVLGGCRAETSRLVLTDAN